jgi:hypothetical protein
MSLTENLGVLNKEIVDKIDNDEGVADDVEEADEYKQKIYSTLNGIDKVLAPPTTSTPRSGSSASAHDGSASIPKVS